MFGMCFVKTILISNKFVTQLFKERKRSYLTDLINMVALLLLVDIFASSLAPIKISPNFPKLWHANMSEFPHFSGCIYTFAYADVPLFRTIKKCTCMITMYVYVTLRPFAYIFLQLGKMGQKHEVKKTWAYRGRRVVCGERTSYWAIHLFPRGSGGRGTAGRLLVDFVPMLEQKRMRKDSFFQAGQFAALPSFRIRKMVFLWENGRFS